MKSTKFKIFSLATLVALSTVLSSCNKKLKDDIDDLEKQVSDLKDQQTETNNTIGAPLSMTLTTTDDDGNPVSVSKTYKYTPGPDYSYIKEDAQGNYYFDLYSTEVAYWYSDAEMWGTFNPTTKTVTNGGVYLSYYDKYKNERSPEFRQSDAFATLTYTFNNFNTVTGDVDITIVCSTTSESDYNIYSGKPMNATFTFKGKVGAFKYDSSNNNL
jgi:hypothetical protein